MRYSQVAVVVVFVFAALCILPAHADGVPAFSFTSATFNHDSSTAELGYDFTVGSTPVFVTALGYINDGYNGTHTVQIFDVATQAAVSGTLATVTTVGGGPTSNTFTYANLASPVLLQANTEYQIVSQFFLNENYFVQATGFAENDGLTLDIAVYDDYGNPPAIPTFAHGSYAGNDPGDFGPNLLVSAVPEPSSFALLGTGLLGVIGVMKRRFA